MLPLSRVDNMPTKWKVYYEELEEKLTGIEKGSADIITKIRLSINVCRTVVDSLKTEVSNYIFHSPVEEIFFFREIKPAFYSCLIYYLKLFNLESGRPTGNSKLWGPCLTRVLERIQYFFDNNIEFYQYYHSGDTYLDAIYFKRQSEDLYLKLDDYYFSYDASFSTSHDLKVAKIIANERLFVYVTKRLAELNQEDADKQTPTWAMALNWTATKAGLIELLYALQSAGVFNNGASDLKQLASYFEQTFNIELGNYYNVFQEIRLRKKSRTTFLDQLKERLTKRMDEADDNSR